MKLEADKWRYRLQDPVGQLVRPPVLKDPHGHGGHSVTLPVVAWVTLERAQRDRGDFRAAPKLCALDETSGELLVYPTPDKDYELELTYYPPARVR